ncbi:SprT family zinc-dependent metalloprotease [Paenibacillus urinalis]|uniref:SprT family zinc-dependent metalloprotease n=1 Tax=Paenibacillus urinalis TaxID=521520 RepID=A0AAX3N0S4_9BACL|nr:MULTISPECIES: SprT family zinc-dependent metalloprotease [Paenibacillus]WDH83448.1 SprT family zinc-dependent metalloprotease [Paenibacillus urinalis]WDH99494.1 SprT family zinc-dependent metalloprotease [Paenibacillus urinalis]WDI03127.1 SprT family zinc-dependent metalloprotease [Paenibacillus urinalis]GAK41830.1 hypothetical protein TCA2_4322 [Paenibacillus sp. TCA20]
MPLFQYGTQTIEYKLKRSDRRKTVSISVNQEGVQVVAPNTAEEHVIENILHRKGTWLRTQLLNFEEMKQSSLQRRFVSGEKLPYLGRQYRLKVIRTNDFTAPEINFYQGQFRAYIHTDIPEHQYREILMPLYVEWVKHRGMIFTKDRVSKFTDKFQQYPNKIIIKDQEQRWGSCTTAGNMLLNWRIFLAPASIVDYVLVHELVHLKYMNHSKEYWETVRMLLPDYEQKKDWLRVNGSTLNI